MEENNQVGADDGQLHQSAGGRAFRRYQHLTKQLLYDLHVIQGKSTVVIAKELGLSRNTIWEYMEMHGIPRRASGKAGADAVRKNQAHENIFAEVRDPDVAYVVGFIMGDGHISNRGSARRLQIALALEDRQILDDIATLLGDKSLVRIAPSQNENEQPKALLAWGCSRACDDLVRIGVPLGKKSSNEVFLDFGDPRLTWAFVRGASDADGSIRVYERSGEVKGKMYGPYRRARWSITIGEQFVSGLHAFLDRQGVPLAPKAIQSKQGTGLLEISDQASIRMLRDHMYAYGSLQLRRKAEIFAML
jgi:hypothetical protein